MEVTIDITNYTEAIDYVLDNNPVYEEDEEKAREVLDRLIRDSFTSESMISSGGFTVYCSDYSDDNSSAFCEILVKPGLCKQGYYFQMEISTGKLKI